MLLPASLTSSIASLAAQHETQASSSVAAIGNSFQKLIDEGNQSAANPPASANAGSGMPKHNDAGNDDGNGKKFILSVSNASGQPQPQPQTKNTPVAARSADNNNTAEPDQTNDADDNSKADDSVQDAPADLQALLMALLVQLQGTKQPDQQPSVQDSVQPNATDGGKPQQNTASLDDLIHELTALLTQALGQPAAGNAQTPADPATVQTDANSTPQDTQTDQTNAPQGADAMQQLMQALLAQLQQGTPQQGADAASTEDDLQVGNAGNNTAPLQDTLNKLVVLLKDATTQSNTQATASDDEIATASSANITLPVDAKPTAAPLPSTKPAPAAQQPEGDTDNKKAASQNSDNIVAQQPAATPVKDPIHQAVEKLMDALSNKQARGDDNNQPDNAAPSASPAQTQNVALAPAATQQSQQPSDFFKAVQQSTPQTPVQDQVVVHIRNAVNDGASQIRIQLHPEDLGKVDVQLTTSSEGKTSVTISSDNRNTLALLQNEARALQDALRDIGLKTDAGGLSFNLRDSGQDARNASKQQQGSYTKVAAVTDNDDFDYSTAGALYRMSVQHGLDISV